MASDRESLLRQLLGRWNEGERDFDAAIFHPEAELRSEMTGMSYGADELSSFFAEIDQQFSKWQIIPDEFIDLGSERMLVLGRVELRGRASGLELVEPVAYLVRLDGGRVSELTAFPDHDAARRAAGLG